MKNIINITDAAREYLMGVVDGESGIGIRIDVVKGGCKGMTYSVQCVQSANSADLLFDDRGLKIYVAPKAVLFVAGMNMDYVKGVMGSNIVFENPNASGCSCGKSFGVAGMEESDCSSCCL